MTPRAPHPWCARLAAVSDDDLGAALPPLASCPWHAGHERVGAAKASPKASAKPEKPAPAPPAPPAPPPSTQGSLFG